MFQMLMKVPESVGQICNPKFANNPYCQDTALFRGWATKEFHHKQWLLSPRSVQTPREAAVTSAPVPGEPLLMEGRYVSGVWHYSVLFPWDQSKGKNPHPQYKNLKISNSRKWTCKNKFVTKNTSLVTRTVMIKVFLPRLVNWQEIVVTLWLPRGILEDFDIVLPLSFSSQCLKSYLSDEPWNFRTSHHQLLLWGL